MGVYPGDSHQRDFNLTCVIYPVGERSYSTDEVSDRVGLPEPSHPVGETPAGPMRSCAMARPILSNSTNIYNITIWQTARTENSLATTSRFNAASPLSRALCWATILKLVLCAALG